MTSYITFALRLYSVLHTQPTLHIISLLHAQPMLLHCSLHYSLAEWISFIIFTLRLKYVLYKQPPNLCIQLFNYHTQPTFHIISILHAQTIIHHSSLHYRFAEWNSYITFALNIIFVLHGRPTKLN